MFVLKSLQGKNYNVSFCVLKTLRKYSASTTVSNFQLNEKRQENEDESEITSEVIYNTVLGESYGSPRFGNRVIKWQDRLHKEKMLLDESKKQPLPLSLKYVLEEEKKVDKNLNSESGTSEVETVTKFPFQQEFNFYSVNPHENQKKESSESFTEESTNVIEEEIRKRYKVMKDTKDWMTGYDNFENDLTEENDGQVDSWTANYGTPDPHSAKSNVPCGGCGALLHCKNASIPGYIPSEIFKNVNRPGSSTLESIICQRCYFLKEHNLALQVQVSPEDYPKILQQSLNRQTLVVLIVDLTDFPCSIWPGIADIIGPKTPVIIVGNKIDLLPSDGKHFLNNVQRRLLDELRVNGFGSSNIMDVKLISAKTGYGVEQLITTLFNRWRYRGDVYLVGCTNVGKSSLFNSLLQSDYCKVQAVDLVQRATISRWPGTTLNLLKFPILRPSKYRLYLRFQRLMAYNKMTADEQRIRKMTLSETKDVELATLMGTIGRTFSLNEKLADDSKDNFSVQGSMNALGKLKMGVNEKHSDYVLSKWCFDTPGVVQPDQILNILTIDELMFTIPKKLIEPETFCIKPGTSLFIAGLARLDYLEGKSSVRLTVFRSNDLPITICSLEKADDIYKKYLGTQYFKVPINEGDRLSKWPGLQAGKPISVVGLSQQFSSKDIVLSSAGWIAISCKDKSEYKFQAWTPEKRGIYVRDCLLPYAVTLRGHRIRGSITYKGHRFL